MLAFLVVVLIISGLPNEGKRNAYALFLPIMEDWV